MKLFIIGGIFLSLFMFSVYSEAQIYENITVVEAYNLIQQNTGNPDFVIMDVRTLDEYEPEHIANAINLDYYSSTFSTDLDGLDKNKAYLIYCLSGGRSGQTFILMQQKNFSEVYNMLGGINEWKAEGYPVTNVLGINTNMKSSKIKFNISPNPCSSYVDIEIEDIINNSFLRIITITGLIIYEKKLQKGKNRLNIDVSEYNKGIYILQAEINNTTQTEKLIIDN